MPGKTDQEIVIKRRIHRLETELQQYKRRAEKAEELVGKEVLELAEELEEARKKIKQLQRCFLDIAETAKRRGRG